MGLLGQARPMCWDAEIIEEGLGWGLVRGFLLLPKGGGVGAGDIGCFGIAGAQGVGLSL